MVSILRSQYFNTGNKIGLVADAREQIIDLSFIA